MNIIYQHMHNMVRTTGIRITFLWETRKGAPLKLFGWPDDAAETTRFSIEIPKMSSLILTTHVRDGVKVARRYRLGKDITDIIQQHHGTNVIAYFYEKAKRLKGKEAVNVDNFRYPGPKPQTKEAALVLLADSVEASSRTMQNPTRRNITTLVRNVVNTVVLNGQLDECNLTLKDLNEIAKSFDKTLNGIYHRRIEYPSDNPAPAMDGLSVTGTDANPHRQQTESLHRRSTADKEKGGYPAEGFGVS